MEEWEIYSRRLGYGVLFVFILFFSFLILVFLGSPQATYIVFFNLYGLLGYLFNVTFIGVYGIYLIQDSIYKKDELRKEVVGKTIEIVGINPLGLPYGLYKGMKVIFYDTNIRKGIKVRAGGFRMEGDWPSGIYVYETYKEKE
ncbi:hypothetical protein ACNF42_02495 [Cuniculiplasma sp. SKW3]|uniref:hypothetical protein n=1 Tax=Cuniculiplasma sp. SKW3 TaxID=3400170 RepID=UPI003FD5D0A0